MHIIRFSLVHYYFTEVDEVVGCTGDGPLLNLTNDSIFSLQIGHYFFTFPFNELAHSKQRHICRQGIIIVSRLSLIQIMHSLLLSSILAYYV